MKRLMAVGGLLLWWLFCPIEAPAEGHEQVPGSEPSITILREGAQVSISFTGTLQSTAALEGPWTEVTNATSPFKLDLAHNQRFYRTRESGLESIFASRSAVAWTITGPLQTHFELAFAGAPDGIFPPKREKPYFAGTLAMAGLQLPVSLRVRGNSSLQECPFPKLKLKIAKEHRPGTPFFDAREIKIGTHCAEGGRGNIGRLRDETATFREALAYETLALMGFVAPRVRRAQIDYHDTSPTNTATAGGWQIRREALILDDVEVVAERLGGRVLNEEEIVTLPKAAFAEPLITELQLFHALIGNWDYRIEPEGQGIWNTDVIQLDDGTLVPVAGDFDLASWVTGVVRLSAPHDYHPELGDVERQARFEIEQIQKRVSPSRFITASQRFTQQRSALEAHIAAAQLDEPGRANALRHISAFFEAMGR